MAHCHDSLFAVSHLRGSPEYPALHGCVKFKRLCSGVLVTAEVFNLPVSPDTGDGVFALHIHEGSCCTGILDDPFAEAGEHYNPSQRPHPYHAGDLPPLFGNRGYAYMSVFTDRFTINEIIGRVIILHAGPDDFTSQPAGNAGAKIACGEIRSAGDLIPKN